MERQIDLNTIVLCNQFSRLAECSQVTEISHWLNLYAFDAMGSLAVCSCDQSWKMGFADNNYSSLEEHLAS